MRPRAFAPVSLAQGFLRGFDQTVNLILDECHERVYSQTAGVEQVVLGLYIIRGDNVYVAHQTCRARVRSNTRQKLTTWRSLALLVRLSSLSPAPWLVRWTRTRIRRLTFRLCAQSR